MNPSLSNILNSDRLPTLPEVAVRVIELAKSEEPDLREIAATVKADPAISASLLKTTNSALMGLRQRASSVESAVPILGASMVRSLVLGFTLAEKWRGSSETEKCMRNIWRRSLIQASAAELFASRDDTRDEANWFLAGLLQDIGQLAMLHCCGGDYWNEVFESDSDLTDVEIESASFGFNHVDVSVELCRRWGIDEEIVSAIAGHHVAVEVTLDECTDSLSSALVAASHCADYLVGVVGTREFDRGVLDKLLTNVFAYLPEQVTEVLEEIDYRVNEMSAALGINAGTTPPIGNLLRQAQKLLAEIAIEAQLRALGADQRREVVEQQLAEALEESSRLRDEAWCDTLTGVYSRNYLDPAVKLATDDCHRKKWALGCLFLDVDGFKQVNDRYGHQMGDDALCQVAEILKESVRRTDYVIRYGGDEFCVLLVDVNEHLLWRVAERVRERIAAIRFEGTDARVSGSIGALICRPGSRQRIVPKKLIALADRAMYESKKLGGDRVSAYQLKGRRKTRLQVPHSSA